MKNNLNMNDENLLMIDIYKKRIVNREESVFSSRVLVITDHANYEEFQQRDNVHSMDSIDDSSKRRMKVSSKMMMMRRRR